MSIVLRSRKTLAQRYRGVLRKYGTLSHLWDFGVAAGPLAYAATHTAAEFSAAYPAWHLYQDTAGTIPACKITDGVGLCLDTGSGSVVLGPNLVVNGSGSTLSGWTSVGAATPTLEAGRIKLVCTGAPSISGGLRQDIPTVANTTYKVSIAVEVSSIGTGRAQILVYDGAAFTPELLNIQKTAAGTYTLSGVVRATTSVLRIYFLVAADSSTTTTAFFSSIVVQEVIGNHASQSTTTKRPILGARFNLLTATEDFNNASWAKTATGTGSVPVVTQNFALAPDGSATAARIQFNNGSGGTTSDTSYILQMYSGAAGSQKRAGFWARLNTGSSSVIYANISGLNTIATITDSWSFYTISSQDGSTTSFSFRLGLRGLFTPTQTLDLLVWHPDLRPANSPTNIPAYQRVTSATDYDTVGFPVRALFDGVDDCLVVPSLDLSMTDKVTVVAGVTKLSDANGGMVCELTNDTNSYNGSLFLLSPRSASYSEPAFTSKGTSAALAAQSINSLQAPRGMVLSATASISTDSAILSVNDSVYGTSASDQGTGNFSAGPFNIGARNGGASAPFNGAIQSLAVIGALLPDGEVQILEASANAAMGKVY